MKVKSLYVYAILTFLCILLAYTTSSTRLTIENDGENLAVPLSRIIDDDSNHLRSNPDPWAYSFVDEYGYQMHEYNREGSTTILERDYAEAVKQTSDGGYIIAGYTKPFRDGEIQGDWDIWLIKTDAYGTMEWDKTFGDQLFGYCDDVAYDVIESQDGGFVIVGYSYPRVLVIKTDLCGSEEWQKTFLQRNHSLGMGVIEDDMSYMVISNIFGERYGQWLMKLDFNGSLIWEKKYEGYGMAIAKTSDKGFILAGSTEYRGYGSWDLCLTKTDYNGVEQWNRTYGGTGFDWAGDVDTCVDSGFFLTGDIAGGQYRYLYVVKTDEYGNELWERTYGTPNDAEVGNGIVGLSDGGCIAVGTQGGRYTSHGSQACVIRYEANGNELWNRTYGGSFNDVGSDIIQNEEGDFVVAGAIGAENDEKDVWLFKLDAEGNMLWEKRYNRLNNPDAPSITGPSKGVSGVAYEYRFNASDVEGDDLFYLVDWGDGTSQEWLGPYPSGVEVVLSHVWDKSGLYVVKAKVKDVDGLESAWSKPHVVTMPKSSTFLFYDSWIEILSRSQVKMSQTHNLFLDTTV